MIVQVDPGASATLVHKLAQMQESGKLCDFTIIISGSQIKAHKCILAACCDYFKTSFNFNESSQPSTQTDLTHLGCEVSVVENVIRSFYTNEIDLDPKCLKGILQLVDYFICESLRLRIEVFMESTLTFHTAVMYFHLALQYGLNSTTLIKNTKRLLRFHFHDYFIYQSDTLESSTDMIGAYMTSHIFLHCNPLQLVEFMLNNVKNAIEKLQYSGAQTHTDSTKALCEKVNSTFEKLFILLNQVRPGVLEKWKPRLLNYLKTWKECNSGCCSELHSQVQSLETELNNKEFNTDCLCSDTHKCNINCKKLLTSNNSNTNQDEGKSFDPNMACTNPNCQLKKDRNISALWSCMDEFEPDDEEYMASSDYTSCNPNPVRDHIISMEKTGGIPSEQPQTLSVTTKSGLEDINWTPSDIHTAETVKEIGQPSTDNALDSPIHCSHPSKSVDQAVSAESMSRVLLQSEHSETKELQSNILVVLAPSAEMTAQLMAIEDEHARPLLRSPQLELSYYDIEMNSWCRGCKLDFPIHDAMLEQHSWRMAYLEDYLFMFSLDREIGLQYDIVQNKWTNLDCQQIFTRHDNVPVKSVIPINVGRRLIVLSMSHEGIGCGSFKTQQRYFEMQPVSRTFVLVASVEDDKMGGLPIIQWTVSEDTLIIVKSSTMIIQYIHFYKPEIQKLETHEVFSAMEPGFKLLVRDQVIYFVDKENWYKRYNLKSLTWTNLQRYLSISLSSFMSSNSDDSHYPALRHVSCQAGSSYWEVTTSSRSLGARMLEMAVSDEGELSITSNPPPPFQFMTAMCPGSMSKSKLNNMTQPRFVYVNI